MAVVLILEPIFEADFHECSHGFRPGRKAHDALEAIRENLKAGRTEIYDADLKGYFDSIPHDKLMACVRMRVTDGRVLELIRGWLCAPVIEEDETGGRQPPQKTENGTPQGGVISPLLANIYLHWMDVMFHRANGPAHWANARLVRYADDCAPRARSGSRKAPAARVTAPPMRERSLGICLQEPVPNHLRLLWSKAMVVSTRRKRLGKNRVRYATGS
jgi:RNA-directed DNA polymerase